MASGLDPAVCKAQAEVLENQGAKIKKIETTIDGLIGELQTSWWGPDSKQFKSKWDGAHKQDLTKAAKQLKKKGKAKVTAKVSFTPTDGTTRTKSKTVKLAKKKAKKRR